MHIVPVVSRQSNRVQFNVWGGGGGGGDFLAESSGKMCITLHGSISVSDRIQINKLNKSIAAEPLYEKKNLKATT